MEGQIFTYLISPRELPDCETHILSLLNYDPSRSGLEITRLVKELLKESMLHLEIRGGFRLFDHQQIKMNHDTLICNEVAFHSQTTIVQQLSGSNALAFFAVTLGSGFDAWSRAYFSRDEPFYAYVADLIGSVRADQAADWLENNLASQMASKNLRCTNRFSPGYCGWDVSEQHKLFSLFPEHFLGITLTPSALMTPLKSISGVIGIGHQVEKLPYTCEFCDQDNCFMRR